jgi:regulatory protein
MNDSFDPTIVEAADIRLAAMDLLARREHSRSELWLKLKKRFGDDERIHEQLDRLSEENLQSDSRFAESFLRQRIGRGHGPMRIRQEMRQRGIADGDIAAALEAEQPDWCALAEATYRRKFGALPPEDIKARARRSRFMQYRGFGLDQYQHLLD